MDDWFYGGGMSVLRVLAVGVPAYIALIVLLRVSGKRTLSKMNAFDLVITVAFGSVLASILLTPTLSLTTGIAAFALLIGAQFVITWLSVRSAKFQQLVKANPSLLYFKGQYDDRELRRVRVTREEVEAAARQQGYGTIGEVAAVVLETDGSLSILSDVGAKPADSFVRGISNRE